MGAIAIFAKVRIQAHAVLGDGMELRGEEIELGADILELVVHMSMLLA